MQELDYAYMWLSLGGIYNNKMIKLKEYFGDIREMLSQKKENLKKIGILNDREIDILYSVREENRIEREFEKIRNSGIAFTHINHNNYPDKLRTIFDPPQVLFVKGELPDTNEPLISIVGARDCSEYGKNVAYTLAKQLGNCGVGVVSGLALGIDVSAHKGTLSGVGKTYAVLGCGVDVCYPRGNIETYTQIVDRGGIISEYLPGTPPLALQFPMRNRIISGMSDAVIIVEAKEKSGSLITVDQALEQNREVFAVPGRLDDRLSKGCNNLIKMGARMLTDIEDVLEFLNEIHRINVKNYSKMNILLARNEKIVYSCLDLHPKSLNDIVNESKLSIHEAMESIMGLQMKGLVRETLKNYYVIEV